MYSHFGRLVHVVNKLAMYLRKIEAESQIYIDIVTFYLYTIL